MLLDFGLLAICERMLAEVYHSGAIALRTTCRNGAPSGFGQLRSHCALAMNNAKTNAPRFLLGFHKSQSLLPQPCPGYHLLQPLPPSLNPGRIVFGGDRRRGVTEEHCHVLQTDSSKKQ